MRLRLGTAGGIPYGVTKDTTRKHHEGLRQRPEIYLPAGLAEDAREGVRQVRRIIVADVKLKDAPGSRLIRSRAFELESIKLAHDDIQIT